MLIYGWIISNNLIVVWLQIFECLFIKCIADHAVQQLNPVIHKLTIAEYQYPPNLFGILLPLYWNCANFSLELNTFERANHLRYNNFLFLFIGKDLFLSLERNVALRNLALIHEGALVCVKYQDPFVTEKPCAWLLRDDVIKIIIFRALNFASLEDHPQGFQLFLCKLFFLAQCQAITHFALLVLVWINY